MRDRAAEADFSAQVERLRNPGRLCHMDSRFADFVSFNPISLPDSDQ